MTQKNADWPGSISAQVCPKPQNPTNQQPKSCQFWTSNFTIQNHRGVTLTKCLGAALIEINETKI